jgi:parallel beta-helix repeat protein
MIPKTSSGRLTGVPTVRMSRALAVLALLPLGACSSASTQTTPKTTPPPGPTCTSFKATDSESDIAGAIATTKDGDCFTFAAGTYKFDNQLAFGTGNGVTMTGAGIGQTIFDFSAQVAGDDGIFAQSVKNLTLQKFSVQNTPGNGIKALDVTGLTFDTIGVTWTGANASQHGAYGLYPVQCKDVLIQGSQISGASDSGVYVGQCQEVVVRNNEAFQNVAGIEIENTYSADVYGNNSHDNTAGILAFSLPNLQQEGGHSIYVHNNQIENNNTKNFASKGDIVSIVPAGTGSFVMACDHVEFFDNTFVGNKTGALAVISYYDSQLPITDKKYYPYPSYTYLHGDTFMNNGTSPDALSVFGLLLDSGLSGFPGMMVSNAVLYDGITDPKDGSGSNSMHICVEETNASTVCDLHLSDLNSADSNLSKILTCTSSAASPFDCTLPALPKVSFPGLTP